MDQTKEGSERNVTDMNFSQLVADEQSKTMPQEKKMMIGPPEDKKDKIGLSTNSPVWKSADIKEWKIMTGKTLLSSWR